MKILVIGDTCKDVFVYGSCDRLCPDAPVPVFIPSYQKENRGMAGNVYENLISFSKVEAHLIANDSPVIKTRYVHEVTNHLLVRVDSGEEKIERIKNLKEIDFSCYDVVVVSDYDKGFLTREDIFYIGTQHPVTFLDTKKLLGGWAESAKYIKINNKEYDRTHHTIVENKKIKSKLIITMGSRGCRFREGAFPVSVVEIKDTTGAGDSFLAALVFRYVINGGKMHDAISFANECASLVVQQRGVSTIR